MLTILLSLLIFICVYYNQLIVEGATAGLMLWFYNVIPLLLPFMLISKILVSNTDRTRNNNAVLITLFLGVMCGYPIGACLASDFLKKKMYTQRTAQALLPLCNNASPMFITGYIAHRILQDKISIFKVFLLIYVPYITYLMLYFLTHHKSKSANQSLIKAAQNKSQYSEDIPQHNSNTKSVIGEVVENISYIGVYIIICSVIMQLILQLLISLYNNGKISDTTYFIGNIFTSTLELTRGAELIAVIANIPFKIKEALILAITSFGGISAILQTGQVIRSSGLSIKKYMCVKFICASFTFTLAVLLL